MVIGYVCRHGQTEWNVQKISQGWKDSPLTKEGINHAKSLSKRFSKFEIEKIITSDLGRTVETANIINKTLKKELFTDKHIREISCGIYEGQPEEILLKETPKIKDLDYRFPNGESASMLIERISIFLKNFEKTYGTKPFLIVSHQGAIKAMAIISRNMLKKEFYKRKIPHDSMVKIILENGKIKFFKFLENET